MKNVMLMMLGLVLVAGPASAGLIYDTGFETVDTFADNTSVDGKDGWTEDNPTCETKSANKISGDLSMEMIDAPGSPGQGDCHVGFTADYGLVSTDFKIKKLNTYTGSDRDSLAFYFMDGPNDGDRGTSVAFTEDTTEGTYKLVAHNGGSSSTRKSGLSADTVYTVRMEANYGKDIYNVYLDGERVATHFNFRNATDAINRLRMFSNDPNDRGAVDDVRIWNSAYESGFESADFTVGDIDGQGGWTGTATQATISTSSTINGGQSLKITRTTGDPYAERYFVAMDGTVVAKFKVKISTGDRRTRIKLMDFDGTNEKEVVFIGFGSDGTGKFYAFDGDGSGGSTLHNLTAYTAGQVYDIKIVADVTNHTYDFYVDDNLLADDYGFINDQSELDVFHVEVPDNLTATFDDLVIIPEPATMTLLLLGLPFALRRRRR